MQVHFRKNMVRLMGVALAVVSIGCYETGGQPKSASVSVEAAPAEPLLLIVSTRFDIGENGEVIYSNIDSIFIADDFANTYQLNDEARFVARLVNPTESTEDVHIQVHIDGDLEYDRETALPAGDYVQYLYRFSLAGIS